MVTGFVKICKRYVKVGRKKGKLHKKFVLTVLEYIRATAHGDIKREIIEQVDRVSVTEFVKLLVYKYYETVEN